jgi:hypothetical protein
MAGTNVMANQQYSRTNKPWTKAEDNKLKELYPTCTNEYLGRLLGRTTGSVSYRGSELGLEKKFTRGRLRSCPPNNDYGSEWTAEEITFLRKNYAIMTAVQISDALQRTINGVKRQARVLGLQKERLWTQEEEQRLREIYDRYSLEELSGIFGFSIDSVSHHARKIGLSSKLNLWTKEETDFLADNYDCKSVDQMYAEKLSRHSVRSIQSKARNLGLVNAEQERPWIESEDEYLKKWFLKKSLPQLEKALDRNRRTIVIHARRIGLYRPYPLWTKDEKAKVKELYDQGVMVSEIARNWVLPRLEIPSDSEFWVLSETGIAIHRLQKHNNSKSENHITSAQPI